MWRIRTRRIVQTVQPDGAQRPLSRLRLAGGSEPTAARRGGPLSVCRKWARADLPQSMIFGRRPPRLIHGGIQEQGHAQFVREQNKLGILTVIEFELQILRRDGLRDGFLRFRLSG